MKITRKISIVYLSALLFTGCTTFRIGDFTVISTKNIDIGSPSPVIGDRVKGIDKSANIAYLKNAVDQAIQKDKCAVGLSDVVISLKQGFVTVSYIAEGNLIIDKSKPGCK